MSARFSWRAVILAAFLLLPVEAASQIGSPDCLPVLRLTDTTGRPVVGARLRVWSDTAGGNTAARGGAWQVGVSDSAGRLPVSEVLGATAQVWAPGFMPRVVRIPENPCEMRTVALRASLAALPVVRVHPSDTLLTDLVIPYQRPTGHGEELLMNAADPSTAGPNNGDFARVAAALVGFNRSADGLSVLGLPASTNQLLLDGLPVSSLQLPRDATVMGRAGISSNALAGGYAGAVVHAGTIPSSFREFDVRVTSNGAVDGVGGRTEAAWIPSVNAAIGSPLPSDRGGFSMLINTSTGTLPMPPEASSGLLERIARTRDRLGLPAWQEPARSRATMAMTTLMLNDVVGGVATSMLRVGAMSSQGGPRSALEVLAVPGRQDGIDVALQNRWRRAWPWGRISVSAGGTLERQRNRALSGEVAGTLDFPDFGGGPATRVPFGVTLPVESDRRQRLIRFDVRFDRTLPRRLGEVSIQAEVIGRDGTLRVDPTAGSTQTRLEVGTNDIRLLSTESVRTTESASGRAGVAALGVNARFIVSPRVLLTLGGRLDVQGLAEGSGRGRSSTSVIADLSPRAGLIAHLFRRRQYLGELHVNAGRFVGWISPSDVVGTALVGTSAERLCIPNAPVLVPPVPPLDATCTVPADSVGVRTFTRGVGAPSTWRLGMTFRPLPFYRLFWPFFRLDLSRTDRLPSFAAGNLSGGGLGAFVAGDGRRVFAPPGAIDPSTGLLPPFAGLEDRALGVQRVAGWNGASEAAQLSLGMILLDVANLQLIGSVTRAWGRERIVGSADGSTEGAQAPRWAPLASLPAWVGKLGVTSRDGPLGIQAFVEWSSGTRFTPRLGTDVNGDGAANDPVGVGQSPALDALIRSQGCRFPIGAGLAPLQSCTSRPRLTTSIRLSRTGSWWGRGRDIEVAVDLVNLFSWWQLARGREESTPAAWEQGRNESIAAFPVGYDASSRQFLVRPNPAFGDGTADWRASQPTQATVRLEVKVPFLASRSRQELDRANAERSEASRGRAIAAIAERWYFDPVEPVLESPLGESLADSTRRQLLDIRRALIAEHARAWQRLRSIQPDSASLPAQEALRRQAEQQSRDAYEQATERIRAALGDDLARAPAWLSFLLRRGASRFLIGFQPATPDP